jgi:hypothetical protein
VRWGLSPDYPGQRQWLMPEGKSEALASEFEREFSLVSSSIDY